MTVALMVTYSAGDEGTFDRDYYVATHLPLVRDTFGPLGLQDVTGYFPDGDDGVLAVAILTFSDAAAREAVLGSAGAAAVFGDIPRFTNVQPATVPLSAAA